jgi:hypothetical protein
MGTYRLTDLASHYRSIAKAGQTGSSRRSQPNAAEHFTASQPAPGGGERQVSTLNGLSPVRIAVITTGQSGHSGTATTDPENLRS